MHDALGDEFVLVSPRGVIDEREELLDSIRDAHGKRSGFEIEIEDVQVRHQFGDVIVATYQEWQESSADTTGRLSTVVFRREGSKLRWLHVHETWLPDQGCEADTGARAEPEPIRLGPEDTRRYTELRRERATTRSS